MHGSIRRREILGRFNVIQTTCIREMSKPIWLNPETIAFPPVENALTDPDGLLAVGGDLSPQRIVQAYKNGIFPWFDDQQPILWWSPNPRAVLFPEKIIISKSLKKRIKRKQFSVSCDQRFADVIKQCSSVPRMGQAGTWITAEMLQAYEQLHDLGIAHSIEVWENETLVGGLYGLSIGRVFFGESMFSARTDASKVALVYLSKQLQQWGFSLIDCQVTSAHLISMGAEEIDRCDFIRALENNIKPGENHFWSDQWSPVIAF